MVELGGNLIEERNLNLASNNQGHGVGANLADRTEKIIKTEDEDSDATECSSSFDSDLSDLYGDDESDLDSGGPVKLFNTRRRELSPCWRSSVRPIMWRCKWIELQISMLQAQHKKYQKKLEECKRSDSTLEGDGTKPPKHHEVRRKKRRRAEAINDTEAYMSNHNLFSYYETILHPEKKKPTPSPCVLKNPDKTDYESWENDELVDSEDEIDILRVIKGLHSRVVEMRSRVEKVTGEEINLGPQNTSSNTMYGMRMASVIASQLLSGTAVTTEHGEAVNSAHLASEYDDDDVLIDNHRVNDELCYLGLEEEVKKIRTIRRQTPLLQVDTTPHVATNDRATTSTKTTNKRPKTKGRGG